jgi:hypothetical protein
LRKHPLGLKRKTILKIQARAPFYILTSNPQIIRGKLDNWKITGFGHASRGRGDTRINNEIRDCLSRKRMTVSLQYFSSFLIKTVTVPSTQVIKNYLVA